MYLLKSLQKVEVVAVRVLQADHARAPGLILWRSRERHASLAKLGIKRVDVGYCEADMIDPGRIAEQAELATHWRRVRASHLKEKKLHGARRHHYTTVVPVRLREAQLLEERDRPCQIRRADTDVVDASHHAPPFRSDGRSRPLSGRDILIAAKEIGRVEFRFERYQSVVVYPVCLTHAMAFTSRFRDGADRCEDRHAGQPLHQVPAQVEVRRGPQDVGGRN